MSHDLSPQEALQRVPDFAGDGWRVTTLRGGLTNRVYLASRRGLRLVVRLDDLHTAGFAIDRGIEIAARRQAAAAGLAGDVLFSDATAGILISEYVDGRVWRPRDLRITANLEALAGVIRRVHQLPTLGEPFDPRRAARSYVEVIGEQPGWAPFAQHCQRLIDAAPEPQTRVFSHNDMVAGNVVAGQRLMLIDWEYAADNEPMFDFASLSCYHDLQDWQVDILLSAYADGAVAELGERLRCQQRLFDPLQWLWFAARQSGSPNARLAARLEALRQRIR